MFGYILADDKSLTPPQKARYQGCYCGLCRALGACGQVCRLTLQYDMGFLCLLLGSLYEPAETAQLGPCPVHPFRKVASWQSEVFPYAADLNVLLGRLSCLDHWQDERRLPALLEAGLLRRGAAAARERQPRAYQAMQDCMNALREAEARRDPSPDAGAGAFGRLMGELFVWREDRWSPVLRRMGLALGRFIYLMDALVDLRRDEKKGLYNPLSAMLDQGATLTDIRDILVVLMADCTAQWERLPLLRDIDIQRNILYTGAWNQITVERGEDP